MDWLPRGAVFAPRGQWCLSRGFLRCKQRHIGLPRAPPPGMTFRQLKLAWRYRKPLWKYRALIRRRREIGAGAAAFAAYALAYWAYRYSRRSAVLEATAAPAPGAVPELASAGK